MITYKITNNTATFGRRDASYSKTISIEYVDNMVKKTSIIKPNQFIYLVVKSLPLSVHKLRMENMVIVDIVNAKEAENIFKKNQKIDTANNKSIENKKTTKINKISDVSETTKPTKKKPTKKRVDVGLDSPDNEFDSK